MRGEASRPSIGSQPAGAGTILPLLLGFAVLVAARLPGVWPDGRLWAEEAVIYFANAWHLPWYHALATVHTGYLNLPAASAAVAAAHLVPLDYAPRVTVLLALLAQMLPAALLAVSGIAWLHHWHVLLIAWLLIALPPLGEEVWLNTITSQFHALLSVAVILASLPGRGGIAALQGGVLLLAPVCSPASVALLPLFMLRAALERSRPRAIQMLLLLPGTAIQIAVLLTHPEPSRTIGFDPALVLAAIANKQLLLPLLGPGLAIQLTAGLDAAFAAGRPPLLLLAAPVVAFGALGVAAWRCGEPAIRLLYCGGMLTMAVGYFGALTPGGKLDLLQTVFGMRYYYVPAVLTSLTLLGLAATASGPIRIAAGALVAWLLFVGGVYYFRVMPIMASGPAWSAEVATWRADASHPLAVWPAGWFVSLERR